MKKPDQALTIKDCCSKKCFGIERHHGGCCSVGDRNIILGPIREPARFLAAVRRKFQDDSIQYQDVFMEFEEGIAFSSQPVWQNPDHYPCLRINPATRNRYCIFYNPFVRACSIYSIRPQECRDYQCDYLRTRLKTHG